MSVKLLFLGFDALEAPRVMDGVFRDWPGVLKVCRPEIDLSAPSWTTIYTGKKIPEHGVKSVWGLNPDDTAFSDVGMCLWDDLNTHGYSCGVIGMPATWPARPLDGWMVSGPFAPKLDERALYPNNLPISLDYPISYIAITPDAENNQRRHGAGHWWKDHHDREEAWTLMRQVAITRCKEVTRLQEREPVDCLFVGFSFPDFWGHISRHAGENSPDRHTRADLLAAEITFLLAEAFDPEYVAMVSDHGISVGHTKHGTWGIAGPGIPQQRGPDCHTWDVRDLLQVRLPLRESPPKPKSHEGEFNTVSVSASPTLTEEEQEMIEDQMRRLGYLD